MAPADQTRRASHGAQHANSTLPVNNSGAAVTKHKEQDTTEAGQTKSSDQGKPTKAPKKQETLESGKISGKELKAKAKAEKAARREKEKQGRPAQPDGIARDGLSEGKATTKGPPGDSKSPGSKPTDQQKSHHRRRSSAGGQAQKTLALRPGEKKAASKSEQPKKDDRRVPFFEHLYGQPKRHTIAGASKDVHPSVLALGLRLSNYEICGSNARCVATLLVFKEVIAAMSTPRDTSLPSHLTTHLSTQIDYLVSCRPLSVSQGNAIRWLKVVIWTIDVNTPEEQAKSELCSAIDNFIHEKIVIADEVIAESAANRIKDGDVITTYAKSSIVEKSLLRAHKQHKKFKVIVVDSRPLFEGRNLVEDLAQAGIEVEYSLLTGLSHAAPRATKAILGAHSMLANGRLYSRAGTGMVALMAKASDVPVIVCCESIKLSERVALDCFVHNEIGPEEELIPFEPDGDGEKCILEDWRDIPNLSMLNMLYDLTPADMIDLVITENGNVPPLSVMTMSGLNSNV